MIAPTKGISPRRALLTVGGEVIDLLDEPTTVSRAWALMRQRRQDASEPAIGFDWFVLALDVLRALDVVELDNSGFLVRKPR